MSCSYPLFHADLKVSLKHSADPVPYPEAQSYMETRTAHIHQGITSEQIWFLEHPPLYTAGTSAKPDDLIMPDRFPVFNAGRGGQYTYHGPGQRIVYIMLDLSRRGKDIRCFVNQLESWVIDSLAVFGLTAGRRDGRIGVWVDKADGTEAKIAAIGVRIRRWVSFHGISINLNPNLEHFSGIIPCGISQHGVTSFQDLGLSTLMADLDKVLISEFARRFGPLA